MSIYNSSFKYLFESSYPSTSEGSGICIYFDDPETGRNILLLLRNEQDPSVENTWCIPGGGVEATEDILTAAKREVEEETKILPDDYTIKSTSPIYTDQPTPTFKFHTFSASCDPESIKPTLNDEHTKWAWYNNKNLPTPLHPGFRRFLDSTDFLN